MRAAHLVKALRTILAGIYATALVPACLFALGAGMVLGGPDVGWVEWMLFALAGLVGPGAIFFAMIQIWPWSEDDYDPTSARKIIIATVIALASYAVVWRVVEL